MVEGAHRWRLRTRFCTNRHAHVTTFPTDRQRTIRRCFRRARILRGSSETWQRQVLKTTLAYYHGLSPPASMGATGHPWLFILERRHLPAAPRLEQVSPCAWWLSRDEHSREPWSRAPSCATVRAVWPRQQVWPEEGTLDWKPGPERRHWSPRDWRGTEFTVLPPAQTPGGKWRSQHQRSGLGAGHAGMSGLLFN